MADPTTDVVRDRDRVLTDYLAAMDSAGGGIYTQDFRDGFRHALVMLAACESDETRRADQVRPEVREAARLALTRRNPPKQLDHRPNGCCDYHRHVADGCCHCERDNTPGMPTDTEAGR